MLPSFLKLLESRKTAGVIFEAFHGWAGAVPTSGVLAARSNRHVGGLILCAPPRAHAVYSGRIKLEGH